MKNKNRFNGLRKNYFKVPLNLFSLDLSINAIGLYVFLSSCSEEFNPSVSFLSKKLKVSRNTVYKYLSELQKTNVISISMKGREGETTRYQFCPPSEWRSL